MKVSYNWLSTYFDKKLPPAEKLGELLNAHSFELEGIEKLQNDTVLDFKILPDRAHYALCHKGIAGEASAVTKEPLKASLSPKIDLDGTVPKVAVKVLDSKLCPRYMARRVENIIVSDSPKWLSERLTAIGARSINTIVDATNYVMFDVGQPLHAFDADKIKGAIVVRKANIGEKITILDGREIELKESDLLIADDLGALAIAGVKGGKRAEVTKDTKNIIIESANFNPTSVRKTSTRANLRNDSSKRFENEITPHIAGEAMERVTALILELSKGGQAGEATDVYPKPVEKWMVEIDPTHIDAVTGLSLSIKEIKEILERLSCKVEEKSNKLFVAPPLERLDLKTAEDFADEVGRMYGYENLKSVETPEIIPVPVDKTFYWAEKVKSILVSQGFSETLLYTLVPKGSFEISYPLASDKAALREKLAPKMIEALSANIRNADLLGLEAVKIFEIGKVFPKMGEKTSLILGVSLAKKKKGVTAASVLNDTLEKLQNSFPASWEGVFNIETGPYGSIVEIDLDALVSVFPAKAGIQDLGFKALSKDLRYKPFSVYPFITRDIALFVPSGTSDADVSKVIKDSAAKAAGNLLVKGPDLFDRFEKDGKISYAFRMIFQSFEKTLLDDEVNAFMAKVYDALKGKGWEVR